MARAIECDRCKRKDGIPRPGEIVTMPEGNNQWMGLYQNSDLRMGYESGIDLCPNCKRAFEEFMRGVVES
jgi:hypothetical protein